MRKIIVTSSLPYANGDIHLGHMVEYVQTDIWARFQKLRGNQCHYICGIDAHGTPVMLRAAKEGIEPEALVEQMHAAHTKDFADFQVAFDNYYSTHSEENKSLTQDLYLRLKASGFISSKVIKQAFDPEKQMFLPDRFVKGECPRCGSEDQYGDSCDNCGATYSPLEMKNPKSALSGATPVEKESEHLFFDLPKSEEFLKEWMAAGHLQDSTTNKLKEWFEQGLQAWDISRDKPYFGFQIPETEDKYFYVWLDAPVGYMASFKNFCEANPELNFDEYWNADSQTELYHFIGKDVVYFHSLFWPAVLKQANYRLPNGVFVHGFLTVNGRKMSKSKGTFIKARTYLNHLQPDYLRYYYASKLSNTVEDMDLNLEDFQAKVNSDLVGKIINIASRCAGFITKRFDGQLSSEVAEPELLASFTAAADKISEHYENRQYAAAMREIMRLADLANQYIADKEPWKLAKQEGKENEVQQICSLGINLFRILIIYLQPVLPELAKKVEAFLNVDSFVWTDSQQVLTNHTINKFKPLMTRIEETQVTAMQEEAQEDLKAANAPKTFLTENPLKEEITIDDFAKLDLRIATVLHCEAVEESKKLLRFELDLGGEKRQIFSGVKEFYKPEEMLGKQVIVVANLKPRKMRFGVSEGMILFADNNETLALVNPESEIDSGSTVN
jgi:methionyl-tRNA synthetase